MTQHVNALPCLVTAILRGSLTTMRVKGVDASLTQ